MAARELTVVAGLAELDRTSLRERAVDRVRAAVTTREIPPGTRLVETELSAALGISRGTLREALRQLEHEGLIKAGNRGRLTVCTLSEAELADMFTVRSALEGWPPRSSAPGPIGSPCSGNCRVRWMSCRRWRGRSTAWSRPIWPSTGCCAN